MSADGSATSGSWFVRSLNWMTNFVPRCAIDDVVTVTENPAPFMSLWRLGADGLSLGTVCVPSVSAKVPPVALVTLSVCCSCCPVSPVPSAPSWAMSVVGTNVIE